MECEQKTWVQKINAMNSYWKFFGRRIIAKFVIILRRIYVQYAPNLRHLPFFHYYFLVLLGFVFLPLFFPSSNDKSALSVALIKNHPVIRFFWSSFLIFFPSTSYWGRVSPIKQMKQRWRLANNVVSSTLGSLRVLLAESELGNNIGRIFFPEDM